MRSSRDRSSYNDMSWRATSTSPETKSCERAARLARKIRAVTLLGCGLYGIWNALTNTAALDAVCNSNIVHDAAVLAKLLGCKRERHDQGPPDVRPGESEPLR